MVQRVRGLRSVTAFAIVRAATSDGTPALVNAATWEGGARTRSCSRPGRTASGSPEPV